MTLNLSCMIYKNIQLGSQSMPKMRNMIPTKNKDDDKVQNTLAINKSHPSF